MEVPRDPLGTLLAGLSLLNGSDAITARFAPTAGAERRWSVGTTTGGERTASGATLLEAVTAAYRLSVAELEEAVQAQAGAALERT